MRELIGFWLLSLAITSLLFSLEPSFSIKEKILGVIGMMAILTLLMAGVFLMVGGV